MIDQPVQRWIRHLLGAIQTPHPEHPLFWQRITVKDLLYVIRHLHICPTDWDDEPNLVNESVAALTVVLRQPGTDEVYGDAAEVLSNIGAAALSATPVLLNGLRKTSGVGCERTRLRYVQALAAVAPSHRRVIELFIAILEEEPPEPLGEFEDAGEQCVEGDACDFTIATRTAVAEALAHCDDASLPILLPRLDLLRAIMGEDDEVYLVRLWVALTLWRVCRSALKNSHVQDRAFLEIVREQAVDFVADYESLLHNDPAVRRQAARLVRRMGRSAIERAETLLGAAAFDIDDAVRRHAIAALARIQSSPPEAFGFLMEHLDANLHETHLLRHIGPALHSLEPEALESVVRTSVHSQRTFVSVLRMFGPPVLRHLVRNLNGYSVLIAGGTPLDRRHRETRRVIVQTMRILSDETSELRASLQPELNGALLQFRADADSALRVDAAVVYWKLTKDDAAIRTLAGVVQDKRVDREIRQAAADALGRIGPDAATATCILSGVASDEGEDRLVRESARMAVGRITPPHQS